MADLIDRAALINSVREQIQTGHKEIFELIDEIMFAEPVDAVEVVRCGDCKHYGNAEGCKPFCRKFEGLYGYPNADDFCSYGERREDDG